MPTLTNDNELGGLASRVRELSDKLKLPPRHLIAIAMAETLFPDLNKVRILDLACGHNFPVISWFQDLNSGPALAGYFASVGAEVVGLDEWHFQRHNLFRDYNFVMKWGDARHLQRYFSQESFDLIVSTAYFGYISSRYGTRPSREMELGILRDAKEITRKNGYGIHVLVDGYWQLTNEDLTDVGYRVLKGLGPSTSQHRNSTAYENIVVLQRQ